MASLRYRAPRTERAEEGIRVVGTGRCLFGTERPGTGSVLDPSTGHMVDDVKYTIDNIGSLTEAERDAI